MNPPTAALGRPPAAGFGETAATGLLVSVRSVEEARQAARLPVEVLDLKEPQRGPLGACDPKLWQQCLEDCPFLGQWSAALGEMDSAAALAAAVPPQFAFAKAGPAGVRRAEELADLWQQLQRRLPASVALVAVAYADWNAAGTLPPEHVLAAASRSGLRTLLVDTYLKDGRSVSWHLGMHRLRMLVNNAAAADCQVVVAGGVTLSALPALVSLGVRRVGVRGGVCDGDRRSAIDPAKIARWTSRLQELAPYQPPMNA